MTKKNNRNVEALLRKLRVKAEQIALTTGKDAETVYQGLVKEQARYTTMPTD